MHNYHTTPQTSIACYNLDRDTITHLHMQAGHWREALQVLWPHPYCVLLSNSGNDDFSAVRLDSDGERLVVARGNMPNEALENLQGRWARHLAKHPEERARRILRPLLHLLQARGVQAGDHWDGLLTKLAYCKAYPEACTTLGAFLDRIAPALDERDRKRAFLFLEQVPFHAALKAVVE